MKDKKNKIRRSNRTFVCLYEKGHYFFFYVCFNHLSLDLFYVEDKTLFHKIDH